MKSKSVERAVGLVEQFRKDLDQLEQRLMEPHASDDFAAQVESILVEPHFRRGFMGLTGPSGYNPQPVYEKCGQCDHYRLK